jgi:hypothetical protein
MKTKKRTNAVHFVPFSSYGVTELFAINSNDVERVNVYTQFPATASGHQDIEPIVSLLLLGRLQLRSEDEYGY